MSAINDDGCFDVISFGSTMLRLSVPAGLRLDSAAMFDVGTAGSESNSMVALAAMGKKTAWVSRLTDNFIGRRIQQEIRRFGVDVSRIVWTDEARNEVFFVEDGASPRPGQVVYDRRNSSLAAVKLTELDLEFLLSGRFLHLTGITPALSADCATVVRQLKMEAKKKGVAVSFDVNYRSKLWSTATAAATIGELADGVDVLLLTRDDAANLWGIDGDDEQLVRECRRRFHAGICVLTLGADGAIADDGQQLYRTGGYQVIRVDRLGAGDAFTAGVLVGLLEGSIELGLRYGSAMAAIKMGIRGDYFRSNQAEVIQIMQGAGADVVR